MIQNYFDNVKRILGVEFQMHTYGKGGARVFIFSFLKIIGLPAKWAMQAG